LDFERDKELARQGFYVGYDHVGIEPSWSSMLYALSDDKRLELCIAFIDAGYANKLVLACDAEPCPIGFGNRGNSSHGYAHLLKNFVPRLKKSGVSEEILHLILVETPAKLLTH